MYKQVYLGVTMLSVIWQEPKLTYAGEIAPAKSSVFIAGLVMSNTTRGSREGVRIFVNIWTSWYDFYAGDGIMLGASFINVDSL